MRFKKGYNQRKVDSFVEGVKNNLSQQETCSCRLSQSTWADIYNRPICQNCGRPITADPRTIPIPYWYFRHK